MTDWVSNAEALEQFKVSGPGRINVTSVAPHEVGWTIAYHCKYCQTTTFVYVQWIKKPEKGDYFLVEACPDENKTHHMLRESMARLGRVEFGSSTRD